MLKCIISIAITFLFKFANSQICGLTVPQDPLTSKGLSTPYILSSLDPANPCSVLIPASSVFVEVTILDIDTGNLFVYYPLVVDNALQIAAPPIVPVLPKNSIVGIWFGANGESVTLMNAAGTNSLTKGNCVNGITGSIFGQYAYCNAPQFFSKANTLIKSGLLKIPPIGNTIYNVQCPTTRHFAIVDQDQSDNVLSTYIITQDNKVSQNTVANRNNLKVLSIIGNGSDNRLLDVFVNPSISCQSFKAPSIIEPTELKNSLALNELSASLVTENPALIPSIDPMALVNDNINLQKLNAYRAGVNQPILNSLDPNDGILYCNNMGNIAGPFLYTHNKELTKANPPDKNVGNNLFNFMAIRFVNSWTILNCKQLTGNDCPITVTLDNNGVAIGNNILEKYNIPTTTWVITTQPSSQPIIQTTTQNIVQPSTINPIFQVNENIMPINLIFIIVMCSIILLSIIIIIVIKIYKNNCICI